MILTVRIIKFELYLKQSIHRYCTSSNNYLQDLVKNQPDLFKDETLSKPVKENKSSLPKKSKKTHTIIFYLGNESFKSMEHLSIISSFYFDFLKSLSKEYCHEIYLRIVMSKPTVQNVDPSEEANLDELSSLLSKIIKHNKENMTKFSLPDITSLTATLNTAKRKVDCMKNSYNFTSKGLTDFFTIKTKCLEILNQANRHFNLEITNLVTNKSLHNLDLKDSDILMNIDSDKLKNLIASYVIENKKKQFIKEKKIKNLRDNNKKS